MYIKRVIEKTIKKMVNEFPVIVISGARQVGKSTMLQMIKEDNMNYVTLDDLDARNLALSDPKYFLEQYSYPLLIDEIQYAPNLLPYIKMIVDDKARYTDWATRDDIKANLQVDLILLLDEFDYPPVTIDDVYKEVLEQAENFKKYSC